MEELQLLISLVKDLPAMAIWLLVIFYGYKVLIVGSIYGVIRLAINRIHQWATTPAHEKVIVDVTGKLAGMTITRDGSLSELVAQIDRLRGKAVGGGGYIHSASVAWLRAAIDAKELEERLAAEAKAGQ